MQRTSVGYWICERDIGFGDRAHSAVNHREAHFLVFDLQERVLQGLDRTIDIAFWAGQRICEWVQLSVSQVSSSMDRGITGRFGRWG